MFKPALGRGARRLIDIGVSFGLLVLFMPVIGVVAWGVHRDMGGRIIFRQDRVGQNGKLFRIAKFQTMKPGQERDAARITKWGGFLRRTHLDELPQLAQVLNGDMTLIGRRPRIPKEENAIAAYAALVPARVCLNRRRLATKPGLTGYEQTMRIGGQQRPLADCWHLDLRNHTSLTCDIRTLFRTAACVVGGNGDTLTPVASTYGAPHLPSISSHLRDMGAPTSIE